MSTPLPPGSWVHRPASRLPGDGDVARRRLHRTGITARSHASRMASKMHGLLPALVDRGYATAQPLRHNSARLYHIHAQAAVRRDWRAGQSPSQADAVGSRRSNDSWSSTPCSPIAGRTWLATEQDKLTHFTLTHRIPRQDLPSLTFRSEDTETVRYFPDKLPIGVDLEGGRTPSLYRDTRPGPVDFRAFLERHAELLRALRAWTIRLLVPRHFARVLGVYRAAFREQLAMPLRPMNLDDLRWYFHARQAPSRSSEERFDQAARAFRAPRFRALYRAWLERGEPVLDATLSPVLADKIERQAGQLECHVLPHHYLHLFAVGGHGLIRLERGQRGGQDPQGGARPLSRLARARASVRRSDTRRATVRQCRYCARSQWVTPIARTRARHTSGGVLCRPNRRGCVSQSGRERPPSWAASPRPGRVPEGRSRPDCVSCLSRQSGSRSVPREGRAIGPPIGRQFVRSRAKALAAAARMSFWKEWCMSVIKPRTRGKRLVKHRHALRSGEPGDLVRVRAVSRRVDRVRAQSADRHRPRQRQGICRGGELSIRSRVCRSPVGRRRARRASVSTGDGAALGIDRRALGLVTRSRPPEEDVTHAANDVGRATARGHDRGRWRGRVGALSLPAADGQRLPRDHGAAEPGRSSGARVHLRHLLVHDAVPRDITRCCRSSRSSPITACRRRARIRSRAIRCRSSRSTPTLVLGEAHFASTPGRAPDPTWLTIPQRGLYTGVMILGAVGTGKTSACMYPYVDQLLRWRADDPDRKLGGLVLEVKGDFCRQVRSMLAQAGRAGRLPRGRPRHGRLLQPAAQRSRSVCGGVCRSPRC